MVWSNWQGAFWRSAMLVLLFWTGLAWTQSPGPRPAADPADKIMVVHENGRSTRCRVMETWKLPDGRVAQLLQALESGEMITIVDEPGLNPDVKNTRAMPKRIFAWGQGRQSAPEGSPIPPHMQIDSGVVIKNELPRPMDAVLDPGPVIVNNDVVVPNRPGVINRWFEKKEDVQVVEFGNTPQVTRTTPMPIVEGAPTLPQIPTPTLPEVPTPTVELAGQTIQPVVSLPSDVKPNVGPAPSQPQPIVSEPSRPIVMPVNEVPPGSIVCDPNNPEVCKPAPKRWYPGANIQAWFQGRSASKIEAPKAEIVKTDDTKKLQMPDDPVALKKAEDAKKLKQADDFLAEQNKVVDKQLANKLESTYKTPYSTAMMTPLPSAAPPEVKTPQPAPSSIPNPQAGENQVTLPPTKDEGTKPATVPAPDKRDMWGNASTAPIVPPGKSLLDPVGPKVTRPNDPLMAPERLTNGTDPRTNGQPARADLGQIAPNPGSPNFAPNMAPLPARDATWPLGTQSVQAAQSGMPGQPVYIPVPLVTVPQPQQPQGPPPPQGLEAPNLNAKFNAFSPPPVPKGTAVMPQPNYPPMSQQQMMMQQQMMAQQQMAYQQQLMMQYGYRPGPGMMNPYQPQQPMAMPSQGPMANNSRQYAGPMPPANPFSPPAMQTGYAPAPYPMPQQPSMQQAGFQPTMPTQQQSVSQQVDQLIKTMRENPYPAQREWAAQSLTNFEWRANPQIVPALVQSASQDPAASVRAGCVYCLGRMNAAIEPVFGVLHSMRNDIDPRVRSEVEQTFTRLGQTPMAPGN